MKARTALANGFVASLFALMIGQGALGQSADAPGADLPGPGEVQSDSQRLDALFAQLQGATDAEAGNITEDIWREWSKSGSAAIDLLLKRAAAAMGNGDLQSAINHATAAIDNAPDFAEAYNLRATAYFQLGELGLSLGDIGRVLALNPRHFGALSGLGAIFEELNQPQKAVEVYREALKINPHMPEVQAAIDRIDTGISGQAL